MSDILSFFQISRKVSYINYRAICNAQSCCGIFLFVKSSTEKSMKIHKPLKTLLLLSFLFLFAVTNFAQVDVARQTTAITYPQDEAVVAQFRGTTRFPRMKGEARVKRRDILNWARVTRIMFCGLFRPTVKSTI
jgi:hypothetical protein